MTGFTRSPKLLKGGIILIDPISGAVQRVIARNRVYWRPRGGRKQTASVQPSRAEASV